MIDPGAPRLARSMWKRFALGAVLVVVLSATATATAGLLTVSNLADTLNKSAALDPGNELTQGKPGRPETFLLLGSDKRTKGPDADKNAKSNSDTMLLVRLNPQAGAITVLSIPRDLKVSFVDPKTGAATTDKINAAYADGGPKLALRVVRQELFGLEINHVVNVDFHGFQRAIQQLHGVYVAVDRRYENTNDGSPEHNYADIHVPAGYQKLSGVQALQYVRYRHTDTDFIRSARQQDFLRQAKAQIGARQLLTNYGALTGIAGRYAETDRGLKSSKEILRVLRLAAFSAGHPVDEVPFPGRVSNDPKNTFVRVSSTAALHAAVDHFLNPEQPKPAKTKRPRRRPRRAARSASLAPGLEAAGALSAEAGTLVSGARMPVLAPRAVTANAQLTPTGGSRVYTLPDLERRAHAAYVLSYRKASDQAVNEFYAVQGTTWLDPPILAEPHRTQVVAGRRLATYYDGKALRLVSWRSGPAVYWVSNTLNHALTNKQMLGVAASLAPVR